MYLVINKWVIAVKVSNFSGQYLRNHWTLDIGVLGYIVIVWPKEHSPEVRSFPPGTPCIHRHKECFNIQWLPLSSLACCCWEERRVECREIAFAVRCWCCRNFSASSSSSLDSSLSESDSKPSSVSVISSHIASKQFFNENYITFLKHL